MDGVGSIRPVSLHREKELFIRQRAGGLQVESMINRIVVINLRSLA